MGNLVVVMVEACWPEKLRTVGIFTPRQDMGASRVEPIAEQGGQPERRAAYVSYSKVSGRRPVTLVVRSHCRRSWFTLLRYPVEDITGLGKIADSALANKVYDDSIAKAARESGDALLDVTKPFVCF